MYFRKGDKELNKLNYIQKKYFKTNLWRQEVIMVFIHLNKDYTAASTWQS